MTRERDEADFVTRELSRSRVALERLEGLLHVRIANGRGEVVFETLAEDAPHLEPGDELLLTIRLRQP